MTFPSSRLRIGKIRSCKRMMETEFDGIDAEEIEPGINIEVKGVPQDIEQSVIKADKVSFEED